MTLAIWAIVALSLFGCVQCYPLNFTHKVEMDISVDGQLKGTIKMGIWRQPLVLQVDNFLNLCLNMYDVKLPSGHNFTLKGRKIYGIVKDQFLAAGDVSPNYATRGKETMYPPDYSVIKTEYSPYNLEVGSVSFDMSVFEEARGYVGSEFHILVKMHNVRWKYNVFGQVIEGMDLIRYISDTAGSNDAFPMRDVVIEDCRKSE